MSSSTASADQPLQARLGQGATLASESQNNKAMHLNRSTARTQCGRCFTRKAVPQRTIHKLIVPILLQFLLTFAQGQGPPIDEQVDYDIEEGRPVGTFVGQINTRPGLSYKFSEPPDEFHLDASTGEITTRVVIDREALEDDVMDLFVTSTPSARHLVEVRINILDINDNSPKFDKSSIQISFDETDTPGSQVMLDTATDRDIGTNGMTNSYKIVSGNDEGKFRLVILSDTSVPLMYLENLVLLDREEIDFYQLNISAQDGGSPPRLGYLQVNVTIRDFNDKPPLFDQSDYSAEINETTPIGTSIIQVRATDQDIGSNAEITYNIVTDDNNQFAIDPNTGEVTTLKKLSCFRACDSSNVACKSKSCLITIEARDNGRPVPLTGRAFVTVILVDVNDHNPVIQFRYASNTPYATVEEGAEVGKSVVALVSVKDPDEGLNGRTEARIVKGNDLGHFRLEPSTIPGLNLLKVAGRLDRERVSKYNITVEATDMGTPPRKSKAYLIIMVNDINDHEPVFEHTFYSRQLSESVPAGSFVSSVTATDNDTGVNAAITYEITSGNDLGWFQIGTTTGLVITAMKLDREVQSSAMLQISARDGAPNPYTAYTTLNITIWDENDEAPEFNPKVMELSFPEGTRAGIAITTFSATDNDEGKNGSVRYYLDPETEQDYPDIFQLNPVSGMLRNLREFDREEFPEFSVRVRAVDGGDSPLTSTAMLTITIEDINDNAPIFYPTHYYASVPENTPAEFPFVQVWASDLDVDSNGEVIYSLSQSSSYFEIDSSSGWIKTTRVLPTRSYSLTVTARDGQGLQAQESAVVEVAVTRPQDNPPVFSQTNGYTFSPREDNSLGSPVIGRNVGQVTATATGQGHLSYSITDGDSEGIFSISENNGLITTAKAIDREQTPFFSLTVVASGNTLHSQTTVNISVTDLNDNVPMFSMSEVEALVTENWPVDHDVYLATAYDPDEGDNGKVTYRLTDDSSAVFKVSEDTGMVAVAQPLSQLSENTFDVYVEARDGGSPSLSSRQRIKIAIIDVNDHTPAFDQKSYEVSVSEAQAVNDRFFNVTAVDRDTGLNGHVTYEVITGNKEHKFGIFPDGVLYIAQTLDREATSLYVLTIKASDMGTPARYSYTNVTIYVLDANDNNPKFSNSTFYFSLPENQPAGSSVGTVYASDMDLGKNAELSFHIDGQRRGFELNPRTGLLVTTQSFDREEISENSEPAKITLSIIVHDNGDLKRQDRSTVAITIRDVNDITPEFTQSLYQVALYESTEIGSPVVTVSAADTDSGDNSKLEYSILGGEGIFVIDKWFGQITLNKSLDRETKGRYEFLIMAMDGGEPPLNGTATVVVTLLDNNDNAPEFVMYEDASVSENMEVGTEIFQVSAIDSDLGSSAIVEYAIASGNSDAVFHIDQNSGRLTLAAQLDFETQPVYFLNITATDLGTPSRSSSIISKVTVLDENDNAPVFPTAPIVGTVSEDARADGSVAVVEATDADSGVNRKVTYSIKKQDPPGNMFAIDSTSGIITTTQELDREEADSYQLTVIATDQAHPVSKRLSSEKLVTVNVQDLNDNTPEFVSVKSVAVMLGAQPNTLITVVKAVDRDTGENGRITYEIYSGDTYFSINAVTGEIFLRSTLNSQLLTYDLTIKATDNGSSRKFSFFQLTIFTRSSIENGPTFSQSSYSGQVSENEHKGTSIVTVSASYPANPSASANIEYHITGIKSSGVDQPRYFKVHATSGLISTTEELDREQGYDVFDVEVYAIDKGSPSPRTKKTSVQITLLDKNDSPPRFASDLFELSIPENSDTGVIVSSVVAMDADETGTVTYTIKDGAEKKFDIDPLKGEIRVIGELDRETKSSYTLEIVADDGNQRSETMVLMDVTDVNDQQPRFTENFYTFDIPENTRSSTRLGQISATDGDEFNNAELTYSILSHWGRDKFSLHPHTGIFTLIGSLDYEQIPHYILTVKVQDSGATILSSTATVYLNVVDVNDNAPIFDPSTYSDQVWENATVGTSILGVSATDIDSGVNGRVQYRITGGDIDDHFAVDMATGVISVAKQLDREQQAHYNLAIEALDQAEDPRNRLSSTAVVTVILKDANDNAPQFESSNQITVTENTAVGTSVYQITASDLDDGENGKVEYILEENEQDIFSLGLNDGVLQVHKILDRESQSEYSFSVVARDKGQPVQSTTMTFTVNVGDANDNNPEVNPQSYSATVDENVKVGTSLLEITAHDLDLGQNAELRFMVVSGDDNQDFYLNSHSGELSVQKRLDYERKRQYHIQVSVEDLGDPSRSDSATVTITVEDVNDCAPLFTDSPYVAFVQENVQDVPVHVAQLVARDDDTGFYGRVSYTILEGDRSLFKINSSSGEITALRTLDREQTAEYDLKVIAMDTGSPRLTGTGMVKITVGDVNDNAPLFHHAHYEGRVMENLRAPSGVLQVWATDHDTGNNAKIRYSLAQDGGGRFTINPNTGEISTSVSLNREERQLYRLVAMATDGGSLPRSSTVPIMVVVGDQNDNAPRFLQPAYSVQIKDPTESGWFIVGVTAMDTDSGLNGQVQYSIVGGRDNEKFSIDETTGVVTASQDLTSSSGGFELHVRATDMGGTSLSDEATIQITFLPSSLTGFPVITSTQRSFRLSEDVSNGELITTISATSPHQSASIAYSIVGGNTAQAFEINSQGQVKVKGLLDFEITRSYSLWIQAQDDSDPPLSDYFGLNINVIDENDNSPVFDKLYYNTSLPEEEFAPLTVLSVTATDRDTGDNGRITYAVEGGNQGGAFAVDGISGSIRTQLKLDRELVDAYKLVVTATDHGDPRRTATATVDISVSDKNDKPPLFSQHFNIRIPENAPVGSFVLRITSTDEDIGINAQHTYTFIQNPNNKFAIDRHSGNITVAGKLDRESKDEYILEVAANDGAYNSETSVSIDILDMNDNIPEFDKPQYSFSLLEGSVVGTSIGKVSAVDHDAPGPNSDVYFKLMKPTRLFRIDPMTGVVYTREQMEFKFTGDTPSPENSQRLTVMVVDQGEPPLSSQVPLTVSIKAANQHAPQFGDSHYDAVVAEDGVVGTSVLQVSASDTEDFGENAEIVYEVTSGNGTQLFELDPESGVISVSSSVSNSVNQHYHLSIMASDLGTPPKSTTSDVYILVSEINRNAPVFLGSGQSFQTTIPETRPVSATIGKVTARDADAGMNGRIKYAITSGDPDEMFSIDPNEGFISVAKPLDFETRAMYFLNITASDQAAVPNSTWKVFIVNITDENDNGPEFDQEVYQASVRENSAVGTTVFQLFATDKDSPPNDIIIYEMTGLGEALNIFSLDGDTLIVDSQGALDYESVQEYEVLIEASNPGKPLTASAKILVHVVGEDEFVPRFTQREYSFTVSESASIGYTVGSVRATDQDQGHDGDVLYSLIGDSNMKGFTIDHETGVVVIADQIDREATSEITLDVMAKNEGPIRGNDTDMCQVRIIVRDANDPPQFTHSIYQGSVREDAPVSTTVLKVSAVDNDLQTDYRSFTYSILMGNVGEAFAVNQQSGWISTNGRLDREMFTVYNLTVAAVDIGSPPKTGTASVKIYLDDINDNPPHFIPAVPSGRIMENEDRLSSNILDLTQFTSDLDLPPNQGPYQYTLLNYTNEFTVDANSGVVKAKKVLDREELGRYYVGVRVDDNGAIVMSSNLSFEVIVEDENDNPSSPRILNIQVFAYQGRFAGGKIADVRPTDDDVVGDYRCSISTSDGSAFSIPDSCELHASQLQDLGSYELSLEGSDGVHDVVRYLASVEFERFDEMTVANSIVVKITGMTAETFLENSYTNFQGAIQEGLDSSSEKLVLYAMNTVDRDVDVFVAVTVDGASYLTKNELKQRISTLRRSIEQKADVDIVSLDYDACTNSPCLNGGICSSEVKVITNQKSITDTPEMIFTSVPKVVQEVKCQCEQGFTGPFCEEHVDACKTHPCLNGGTCTSTGAGTFSCQCPRAFKGQRCESDVNECDVSAPCRNGGTCHNTIGSYRCQCAEDFIGDNCEIGVNSCGVAPCLNGGTCDTSGPAPKCVCQRGDRGAQCEVTSKSFEALSYLEYSLPMDQVSNNLQLEFATTKDNALLLFFQGDTASTDFLALEVIQGQVRFSFSAGDTIPGRVTVPKTVNDGNWYHVEASRIGAVGVLKVSECPQGQTECSRCEDGDDACYRRVEKQSNNRMLDSDMTHVLLVGGLRGVDDISAYLSASQPTITTHNFLGCLRGLAIDNTAVLALQPRARHRVTEGCQRGQQGTACAVGVCRNGGKCLDEWTHTSCECAAGFAGKTCDQSIESYSLGPNSVITYTQKESYVRDQMAQSELERRRRRATGTQEDDVREFKMEFRTRNEDGLLFYSEGSNTQIALYVHLKQVVYFSSDNGAAYSITMTTPEVSDGNWHNVTVQISEFSDTAVLTVDQMSIQRPQPSGWPSLVSLSSAAFYVAGTKTPKSINGTQVPGFEGCLKKIELGGGNLPLDGSTERFDIERQGNVSNSCGADFHGPIVRAGGDSPPVHVAIIVIVVFFCIVVLVILVVFVVLRLRRRRRDQGHAKQNGNASSALDKNTDNRSHQDSGFTENGDLSEEAIIRQHIEDELNSRMYQERALPERGMGSRPDLVVSDGRTVPIREPAVVLEPSGFENGGYNEEPPEHYDIDNASSIAPSDLVDVVQHYKQYRRGQLGHHDKRSHPHQHPHPHRHGVTPSPSSMLGSRRESPLTVSRQSPASFSSHQRNSPNPLLLGPASLPRHSPLTVNNLNNPHSRKSPGLNITPKATTPVPQSMRSTPLSGVDGLYSPSNISSTSSYDRPNIPNGHVPSRPNSHLRQPISTLGIRSTPTMGLTVDEVNRLNARHKNSPVSTVDAVSSSSEEAANNKINTTDFTHADLLDPAAMLPPESSSEDDTNDDSFTCSEFEYDNDKMRQDFTNPSRLVAPRLARVSENEDTDASTRRLSNDASDSNRSREDSFSTFLTSDEDMPRGAGGKKLGGSFNWDYLLNWGPNFEKLVGVFTDIAQLPDSSSKVSHTPQGSQCNSPRPPSVTRNSPRPTTPKSVSPKLSSPVPHKPPTPRSVATPSPLHVIAEDGPYRENGVDSTLEQSFDNVREEYV